MQLRAGVGYLILKTGDNETTHCEVYCAGGMFRRISDGKPVEMQYCDEDGEVFSVSTDTNSGPHSQAGSDDWSIGIPTGRCSCSCPLPCDRLQLPPICRRLVCLPGPPSPTEQASTLTDTFKIILLGYAVIFSSGYVSSWRSDENRCCGPLRHHL